MMAIARYVSKGTPTMYGTTMVRADVSVSLDELNKAIDRVSKATGKSLDEVVNQSTIMFARGAGKAMPPSGKWGHPVIDRKRPFWKKHVSEYFNKELGKPEDIEGVRKKNQDFMWGITFLNKSKKSRNARAHYFRHFWARQDAVKRIKIGGRGVAKAQFWEVLEELGVGKPRGAFIGRGAAIAAMINVNVTRGRGFLNPYINITSSIDTAEEYRPYAMVRGLNDAKRGVRGWAKRLEKEQKGAWR